HIAPRWPGLLALRLAHQEGYLHAVLDLQLRQQARDVRLHRRDAHVDLRGDLGIGQASPDGERNVTLALAERGETPARTLVALAGLGVAGEELDKRAGDGWGEHAVTGVDGFDGPDELGRGRVLEHEPGRARTQRAQDELVRLKRGQDQNRRRLWLRSEQAGRRDPLPFFRPDVHQPKLRRVGG